MVTSTSEYGARIHSNIAFAREALREEEMRVKNAEMARAQMIGWLGTDAQRTGTGMFAERAPGSSQFLGDYELDPIYKREIEEARGFVRGNEDPFTTHGLRKKEDDKWYDSVVRGGAAALLSTYSPPLTGIQEAAVVDSVFNAPRPTKGSHGGGMSGGDEFRGGLSIDEYWALKTNSIMLLSKEAAERSWNGDVAGARELQKQADELKSKLPTHVQRAINYQEDPARRAIFNASNVSAQIVGNKIGRSRDLLDKTSGEFKQTYQLLASDSVEAIHLRHADAEGAIVAEQRQLERDTASHIEAGGNPEARGAIMERAAEQAQFMRAQLRAETAAKTADIMGETSYYLENFSTEYAQDPEGFAQKWMDEGSGVRSQYLLAMGNIAMSEVQRYKMTAATAWRDYMQHLAERDQEGGNDWMGTAGMLIGGAVGGYFGGPSGAAAGASAGSSVGNVVGGM